jgi:hypothetical protein
MASGQVNRIKRPNTWLQRPMLQNREESSCQTGAVHTWHKADKVRCPDLSLVCARLCCKTRRVSIAELPRFSRAALFAFPLCVGRGAHTPTWRTFELRPRARQRRT